MTPRDALTDAEVICAWMEPKPKDGTHPGNVSEVGWWKAVYVARPVPHWRWFPNDDKTDSLDALWKVEERLDPRQAQEYYCSLWDDRTTYGAHATAEQKLKALAAVLRGAL